MTYIASPQVEPRETVTFSVESSAVLQRLRTSISEMLNAMPGRVRSTRDLQKLFGLDLKLCWQLMKLAGPGDALSLAPFVPTAGPMKRFLAAASGFGVSDTVIRQIRSAYAAFEEQVAIHAGDRVTFESMASGSVGNQTGSDEDLRRADVKLRKAGFQMHSHYFGAQMDTYLAASILHPSATHPGEFDMAHLRAKLGLRRLRISADFPVDSFKYTAQRNVDEEQDVYPRESLEPESSKLYGCPILTKFSSQPLPQFKTDTLPDGTTLTRIMGEEIGLRSSVNLVFARLIRNAPMEKLDNGRKFGFGQKLSSNAPMGLIIADQLVHRPSFSKMKFDSSVHWSALKNDFPARDSGSLLPFREHTALLEAGVDGARTREVPQYVEMIEYICDQLNWRIEDFDVYRMRVEYPILHTHLWTLFEAEPALS